MYRKIEDAVRHIKSKSHITPKVGLVLGSGLGAYVDRIPNKTVIPYTEIPHFHTTTVDGHEGRLVLATIDNTPIAILQGRYHTYEGHAMEDVVFPTRVLGKLGAKYLILTNAAGGINKDFNPGDLVVIEDHINLMGRNPLVGPNMPELGPRFPDMTRAYHPELREMLKEVMQDIGLPVRTGVYAGLLGPSYETPAEIRYLRSIGADMVGMSTVPETIAANHMGVKVAGISCITNMAAGIKDEKLEHEDVKKQALQVMESFTKLLSGAIKKIGTLK